MRIFNEYYYLLIIKIMIIFYRKGGGIYGIANKILPKRRTN